MQQLEQGTLGRYHILRRLARGGMADIYLARDIETDRVVAVKLVNIGAGDYYERFLDEVKAQAGLSHEHILPVLDHGEFESWCYLVTPYIEHGTLDARLLQGPLSLEETDHIFGQLSQALQHAHDKGIIHRDIKPSNVLMRDGNHVYLTDFGLVKRVGVNNGLTLTGYLIGTPEYMAPELAEKEASPASDVYALGVLLYQMLSGRVPFKATTPIGVYVMHIRDLPALPSTFNPTIPVEIEHVIMRALEKDPERRFASPQELYLAYAQAMKAAEARRSALTLMMTQTLYLQLEKPRVTIVPQKPRMLRGRFLFLLLLAPILFVTVPTLMPNSFTIGAVVKKIKSLQTYLQGKEKKIEGMQVGGSGTRRLGKNSENL
jgi:serine/threonine protein kinase